MDGTLVDSFGDIKQCLEHSYLKILGQEIGVTRMAIGPPLSEMIEQLTPGLSQKTKDSIIFEFRQNYDSSSYPLTTSMSGAVELIERLTALKKRIYIVTNKSYNPTKRILSKLDLTSFADVLSPDKFPGKKLTKSELIKLIINERNLAKGSMVMVGDTSHDILAAKANEIDSVSVTCGYDTLNNLIDANPTLLVVNMTELLRHLNN
ncbi:MAG: HAD family hydrolase [Cyclobacteriaceae bacterium]